MTRFHLVHPIHLATAALLAFAAPAAAQAPAAAATPPSDYRQDANWLCRPGRQDACSIDQRTTVVAANGRLTPEMFRANARAPIDCFYVYPTVSTDPGGNSDMSIDQAERRVVEQQFARFGGVCRTFAPMYRQVTLAALRSGIAGTPMAVDREVGYNDVKAAWNDYLARDNAGRGVVLIGHSQGSGVLKRLIAEEIDGKPIQSRLVSALLLGTNIAVPVGKDVGGDFKSIPLCRAKSQTGCLVSYVTFRADAPPPANSRFGKVAAPGMQAACVNPAALAGGKAPMKAYLAAGNSAIASSAVPPKPWTNTGKAITTPFVSTPGLLTGECVNQGGFSYLALTTNADPRDARTDEITGDVVNAGVVAKDWGLHLIDVNAAMGDLVDLVGAQSKAYSAKSRR